MKDSFVVPEGQTAPTTVVPDAAIIDEIEGRGPGVSMMRPSAQIGGIVSASDNQDLRLPWLEIAYGVGKFATKGVPQGTYVLGGEHLLVGFNKPLRVILLSVSEYWKEYVTQAERDAGKQEASTFGTEAEVKAAGGTTTWGNNGPGVPGTPPTHSLAADLKLFIEKPEGLICGLFAENLLGDGRALAPANFRVDKDNYRCTIPIIKTDLKLSLAKTGLLGGIYEIRTYMHQPRGGKQRLVSGARLVGNNSAATIEAIKVLFGIK